MTGLFNQNKIMEKKLLAEIERIEFKKFAILTPLQNEIRAAQQKIDRLLHQIGTLEYEGQTNGHEDKEENKKDMQAHYDAIDAQKKLIAEKEAKIKEFANKYDEELYLLKSNLNHMNTPGQPLKRDAENSGKAFCAGCGTQHAIGTDIFCGGCGTKLPA